MGFMIALKTKGHEVYLNFPWKVGIVLFMAFPEITKGENLDSVIQYMASDTFFDLIEIPPYEESKFLELVNSAREAGLAVALALQPEILGKQLDIASLDETQRRKAIDIIKERIVLAHKAELSTVAICTGKDPGISERKKALDVLKNSLKELCSFAMEYNILILLEMFDRDYDKKLLLGPFEEAASVVKSVHEDYTNIKLLWDLSHAPMLNETPDVLKKAPELIGHIHIGCAKRVNNEFKDTHPGFYVAGSVNGVEDVAKLLQVLHDIGYKGAVSFEVKPEEGQSSYEVVNSAKGVLMHAASLAFKSILNLK